MMLSKAHLTSLSRMSSSRWVITPSWLSGLWRCVLYSSSVYSCHLFLISSASVRSIPFLSFIVPIFAWNIPLVSLIFLKRSLDFPTLLLSSISLHWLLRKAFLSLLFFGTLHSDAYIFPFLLCFSVLFFSICKASPDSHFAFLHFFSRGTVLIPVSCTMWGHQVLLIPSSDLSDVFECLFTWTARGLVQPQSCHAPVVAQTSSQMMREVSQYFTKFKIPRYGLPLESSQFPNYLFLCMFPGY